MKSRAGAAFGTFAFFWIAPATVAGWIPYALTRWAVERPLLGWGGGRFLGAGLVAGGLSVLLESFARFAVVGRGTPAPIAPTASLVVSGLYRYVRNPMYLGVLGIVLGQALLLGSVTLAGYACVLWLLFHVFVMAYEEPALLRQFGSSYEDYRAHVRRWWPRLSPWSPPAEDTSAPTGVPRLRH
jgi:protein-S-isoprenylcysteine O-methyltransferase Ste14